MSMHRRLPPVLLVLFALGACGESDGTDDGWPEHESTDRERESPRPPDLWDPGERPNGDCTYGYGESCPEPAVDCHDSPCLHGTCITSESGTDYCLCAPAYAGLFCERCATGYVPVGLECVPDSPCAGSPCVHGTCRIQGEDGFTCECHAGYAGTLCDACAAGYHVEDLECVPD